MAQAPMILSRILSLLTLIATVPYALAEDDMIENEEDEVEPALAVLFPPFAVTIGVLVFYVLSRYMKALPYTATMFFMGTLMGIAVSVRDSSNQIHQTILQWININSEVLLLVFLPGLVFKDAFGQNVHLFAYAFWQLLIFAFPIVLAGTVLTALIGYYIFPYDWSFNLSMTFGSILAATDPVAVAALLDEVGAPPRLKVHVGGESLLNDGSAIVFFTIFSARYFFELGYPGLGEEVDVAKGIGLFCRKSFGGVAAGLLFGVSLLIVLFMLDRKFNREENVVQVTTVLGMAYLCYYVSDYIWETSGVIATLTAGLLVKLMGHAMVNDPKLLEDFLALVEHLLNTILFTLGGVVWGAVIADGEKQGVWKAREWGYLILLFVLLTVIRAVQFTVAYPITVRIGLKTNWKETLFQIYGGLRGAVGIALAISIDNTVAQVTGGLNETPEEIHTQIVFGMVGGIAFMSLMINATTAGPLLRKLGLAASTETRQRIVRAYEMRFIAVSVKHMVRLLTQEQYQCVNFALVKHHIPYLADLTKAQLFQAVEADKDTTPTNEYNPPYLKRVLPYLEDNKDEAPEEAAIDEASDLAVGDTPGDSIEARAEQHHVRNRKKLFSVTNVCPSMYGGGSLSAQELRLLFISVLKATYGQQIKDGELDNNHILAVSIDQSLEFAADAVTRGEPLKDWEYLAKIHKRIGNQSKRLKENKSTMSCFDRFIWSKRSSLGLKMRVENMFIERSCSVMAAHRSARAFFDAELQGADTEMSEAATLVMEESRTQYDLAKAILNEYDPKVVEVAISHKFCRILLTAGISYLEKLAKTGLLKESEAETLVEKIEENLDLVFTCEKKDHPGEIDMDGATEMDTLFKTERPIKDDEGKVYTA